MSKIDENSVASILEKKLNISFKYGPFKLDIWGNVDKWCQISDSTYLFLEVETSQKHPNTNVLKLWPYLENNTEAKIFLIQTFFHDNPGLNSSRGKLGEWTAHKLELLFSDRFQYYKLTIPEDLDNLDLKHLTEKIKMFFPTHL